MAPGGDAEADEGDEAAGDGAASSAPDADGVWAQVLVARGYTGWFSGSGEMSSVLLVSSPPTTIIQVHVINICTCMHVECLFL